MNYFFSRFLCWILLLALWICAGWCLWEMLQEWGVFAKGEKDFAEIFNSERKWSLAKVIGATFVGHVFITACLASYRIARRGGAPGGVEVVELEGYKKASS